MPKLGTGIVAIGVFALFSVGGVRQGCRDAVHSLTALAYPPVRDMRLSVVIAPQKVVTRAPDDASVPVTGRDLAGEDPPYDRNQFRVNPVAPTDSSIARGERKFGRVCATCHGATLAGDGPVAPLFMPPPDLLAQATRERAEGFLYSYIRFGGIVMPSYGAQVSAVEAWNIVNYIRSRQKASPR
jgi:mono/diheme cytochrome c family protein